MTSEKEIYTQSSPRVFILSDVTDFTLAVTNKLLNKSCSVLFTYNEFDSRLKEISSPRFLAIGLSQEKRNFSDISPEYVLAFQSRSKSFNEKALFLGKKLAKNANSKLVFIYPFKKETFDFYDLLERKTFDDKKLPIACVFVGDLVSHDSSVFSDTVRGILDNIKNQKILLFSENFDLYPISVDTASENILRVLFSLKSYGKTTAILGKPLNKDRLQKILGREIRTEINVNRKGVKLVYPQIFEKTHVVESQEKLLADIITLHEIPRTLSSKTAATPKFNFVSFASRFVQKLTKKFAYGKRLAVVLGGVFLMPFFILATSLIFYNLSVRALYLGFNETAIKGLRSVVLLSKIPQVYSSSLSRVPAFMFYADVERSSFILGKKANIWMMSDKLTDSFFTLFKSFSGNLDIDLKMESQKISLDLEKLYSESSFLEGERSAESGFIYKFTDSLATETLSKRMRQEVFIFKNVFSKFSDSLENNNTSKYLVLFQNEKILRSTAGKISTFALLTLTAGKITNLEVYDSFYIDENLKGEIASPFSFISESEEKTWSFRDVNWDADFPTSAVQAEWFLDKSLGESIDGVIAIDREFVENFNLSEKLKPNFDFLFESSSSQPNEAENKSERSPELLKATVNEIVKSRREISFIHSLLKLGEEKHIQFFFNNQNIQREFSDLGWDGSIGKPACEGNCFSDVIAPIEWAVTEENSFVKRESQIEVFLEEGLVKRRLTTFFENTARDSYKLYLRILTNPESGFSPVKIIQDERREEKMPEIKGLRGLKEAGVLLEVPGNSLVAVIFSWESPLPQNFKEDGSYVLSWKKQAGVKSYPLTTIIFAPSNLKSQSTPMSSLTQDGRFLYNTQVSKDYVINFSWEK